MSPAAAASAGSGRGHPTARSPHAVTHIQPPSAPSPPPPSAAARCLLQLRPRPPLPTAATLSPHNATATRTADANTTRRPRRGSRREVGPGARFAPRTCTHHIAPTIATAAATRSGRRGSHGNCGERQGGRMSAHTGRRCRRLCRPCPPRSVDWSPPSSSSCYSCSPPPPLVATRRCRSRANELPAPPRRWSWLRSRRQCIRTMAAPQCRDSAKPAGAPHQRARCCGHCRQRSGPPRPPPHHLPPAPRSRARDVPPMPATAPSSPPRNCVDMRARSRAHPLSHLPPGPASSVSATTGDVTLASLPPATASRRRHPPRARPARTDLTPPPRRNRTSPPASAVAVAKHRRSIPVRPPPGGTRSRAAAQLVHHPGVRAGGYTDCLYTSTRTPVRSSPSAAWPSPRRMTVQKRGTA
jgi:hypothetical protein